MISINNLSVEFSARPLFSDVSFVINPTDKIALVGKNGAGKSTMLKILAGIQSPSGGSISKPSDVTVGYLPQQMKIADDTTIIEETKKAFRERLRMEEELNALNRELENTTDFESEAYHKLLDRMEFLNDRIAVDDTQNVEAEIEKTLTGLGFLRSDFNRPTSEFSGGWRMRVELAKILLQRPDVLLLDEPTNHLDMRTKDILKNAIKEFEGTVIVVSHDREFLDGLVSKVYEFGEGKVRENLGGIYDFLRKKNMQNLSELELSKSRQTPGRQSATNESIESKTPVEEQKAPASKLSYTQQKERDKLLKKAEKAVTKAEEEIAALEEKIAEIEDKIAGGDTSAEILDEYAVLQKRQENALSLWEVAQQDLDSLKNSLNIC